MNGHVNIPDKHSLTKSIYEIGFALDDTILFLNTHPKDRDALDYYHKIASKYRELTTLYNLHYGPLTSRDVKSDNYFSWASKPLPWEMEVC